VSFVRNGDDVLLLRHPDHGDRFAGLWNGVGGHVEAGECIRAAARRELREETGLEVPRLSLRAVIHEAGLLGRAHAVFVFVGETDARAFDAPDGFEIAWHPIAQIESLPLVPDVAELLPRALAATEPFFVTELFDGADRVTKIQIEAEAQRV